MISIYDNGGKTLDRYTIFLDNTDDCIGADLTGDGFYQHGTGKRGKHLGKKISLLDLDISLIAKLKEELEAQQ